MKTSAIISKISGAVLAMFIFMSSLSGATGTLSGTVTDSNTKIAIVNALIVIEKNGISIAETKSGKLGNYSFTNISSGLYTITVQSASYRPYRKENVVVKSGQTNTLPIALDTENPVILPVIEDLIIMDEEVEMDISEAIEYSFIESAKSEAPRKNKAHCIKRAYPYTPQNTMAQGAAYPSYAPMVPQEEYNTESYDVINENQFKNVGSDPLSTFSVDVDKASYANVRRMLNYGQMPNTDAVRIEEMINYFHYEYPQPTDEHPFATVMEYGDCPWNNGHKLALIGIKGKEYDAGTVPPSNLVFLIDVSGSMNSSNKLPLLKQSFKLLVNRLRPEDRVAIVVYAGAAGLVLPSTPGSEKQTIINALDRLQSGGSTAGGAGINLAYAVAQQHFMEKGNNRVIMATDGDFNTGESSDAQMVRLIEEKRKGGVFLSVLGFGMGNYKDSKMEQLSNAGNGNYAYIDNSNEANKVFGTELWGTLHTIAKDVKIQIEFNPAKVQSYRLIGYENRMLENEDFNDDKKDAGEIGAGHTVTALYEIVPAGADEQKPSVDPLRYQQQKAVDSKELMTLKLRYKQPDGNTSKIITHQIVEQNIDRQSDNFYFASAVAEFGMLLRVSELKSASSYDQVIAVASQSKGADPYGYRSEFIRLVELAKALSSAQTEQ